MAGELGRAVSSVGQSLMERDKQQMLNDMEIESEKRANDRQIEKEKREYARQLRKVTKTTPIQNANGSWVNKMYNEEGTIIREEALSPWEAEQIQMESQKEKASLDKVLAETDMIRTYGPLLKEAELGGKIAQGENSRASAEAHRARAQTYSPEYQAQRDESRARFRSNGGGGSSGTSGPGPTKDQVINQVLKDNQNLYKQYVENGDMTPSQFARYAEEAVTAAENDGRLGESNTIFRRALELSNKRDFKKLNEKNNTGE